MAFRRPTYRRTRRSIRRYAPRRSYGTRRITRRPIYRRRRVTYRRTRPATNRRIVDVASTKKKDTMMHWNTSTSTNQQFTVPLGTSYIIFSPTQRPRYDTDNETIRNRNEVYMKGFRERLMMTFELGASFRWRRIVFETKGLVLPNTYLETSNGMVRPWRLMAAGDVTTLANYLFAGRPGVDTANSFLAPIDKNHVRLHYDKTITFAGGNAQAYARTTRHYYPFERKMYYDSDENGDEMDQAYRAAAGIKGMGDVYVLDIFQDIAGPTGAAINLQSDSTLYWHEK